MIGLTPSEKAKILKEWEKTKKTSPKTHKYDDGFPDPDVLPLVDKINTLPGVCTLQSCEGHGGGGTVLSPGILWLRLNNVMADGFEHKISKFLSRNGGPVERVSKIFTSDNRSFYTIEFAGNERGRLAESASLILGFFSGLAARTNGNSRRYLLPWKGKG